MNIEQTIIFHGRDGVGASWFHPRPCVVPGGTPEAPHLFMTLQPITGSDYFGPVHYTESTDGGRTWSEPQLVPSLGRVSLGNGVEEGVCDVVPHYDVASQTILLLGHTVRYREGSDTFDGSVNLPRIVWTARSADGAWQERQIVAWPEPKDEAWKWSCGCAQSVLFDDGRLLIPASFVPEGRIDRMVTSLDCRYDGASLVAEKRGTVLQITSGRGLLEPSLTRFSGGFAMTIRAENEQGFVAVSEDGLSWNGMRPWRWEDGSPLRMSTTQQHWLARENDLWLVYTRESEENRELFRWRAPLYMAKMDPQTLCLQRDSEATVLPLRLGKDGTIPGAARVGNFHTLMLPSGEAIVTAGEVLPNEGYSGDTFLARVVWDE